VDKVVAHGHHCACPCCPCLKTWETAVGWPGRLHGGWAGVSREDWLIDQNHFGTQTKAFSFAPPFKNHWDAYAGETMGGQSCCPRAPLCMAVLPMSKNLGKPLLAGLDGSMAVQWEVSRSGPGGGCVLERQKSLGALIKLTATHPPEPRLHPLARRLGHAASTRRLQGSSGH
jgi:hypothetical protein